MCGILGLINKKKCCLNQMTEILKHGLNIQNHRGPDNQSLWINEKCNASLAHNRLSIIDLSENGNQPMTSKCGRFTITYNGEVYNFPKIKKDLENYVVFKGHSDTEVIVECISKYGVLNTIEKLDGMFALAVWDEKENKLFLARDRVGIKPLYWTNTEHFFFFCSDLKCIKALPRFYPEVSQQALSQLLRYGCVRSPLSIFKNVFKLNPGQILIFDKLGKTRIDSYWSADELKNRPKYTKLSLEDTSRIIEKELINSIKSSMISDVPIGAFLSGGVDSSLLVSIMSQYSKKLKTFSVGFFEERFNEAKYAKEISKFLGTNHYELYLNKTDLLNVIPQIPEIYSEPFGDSSQIPTYLVSKMSKKHVKVVLSGDGADEFFGGYNRYYYASKIRNFKQFVPNQIEKFLSKLAMKFIESRFSSSFKNISFSRTPQLSDKLKKILLILQNSEEYIYEQLISTNVYSDHFLRNSKSNIQTSSIKDECGENFFEFMQLQDIKSYLPDDILTKVDRASMYCSQEVRVPYLNRNVIESAWGLEKEFKQNKIILKTILNRYIPKKLFLRPKMGFGIPLGEWLNSSLKVWMNDSLEKKKLKEQGFFDVKKVKDISSLSSSVENNKYLLWNILMFQNWFDNFSKSK